MYNITNYDKRMLCVIRHKLTDRKVTKLLNFSFVFDGTTYE